MKRQSAAKNYFFQMAYQVLILAVPLVLSPYLTRTLGKTGLGAYAYANSIAHYFVLFAMLGISRHGQRIVSVHAHNPLELRKRFWSLLTIHGLFSLLAIVAYTMFAIRFAGDWTAVYWPQIFYVASALFDVTWFFQGLENFGSVILRNTVVKLAECVCIFVWVKDAGDLWLYSLIVASGSFLGQAVMFPLAVRVAKPVAFSVHDLCSHLKPLFVLAVSVLAVSLYTVFDKTLLGLLSGHDDVAIYEYANKIIAIPRTFMIIAGTVLYPRACRLVAAGDAAGQQKYFTIALIITFLLGFSSVFGLLAVASPLVVLYYGESFAECGGAIMAMTPLILIIGIGDILRTQYILPRHMDGQFVACLCLNALVNLAVSIALIPTLGVYGAILGTTLAELFGLGYQLFLCREIVSPAQLSREAIPFALAGLAAFCAVRALNAFLPMGFATLGADAALGGAVFMLLSSTYLATARKNEWEVLRGFRFAKARRDA